MKKLIYGGVAFASMMLVAMACQKENVQPNPVAQTMQTSQAGKSVKTTDTPQEKATGSNLRVWHDNGGPNEGNGPGADYGCWSEGGNCLETVVVSSMLGSVIDNIGDDASSGNVTGVIATVTANLVQLVTIVPLQTWVDVILQKKTVAVRGVATTTSSSYLVFSEKGKVQSVRPVKL